MKTEQARRVRRRVFAIAAGGAALGLGVTATLAAWNDTEWVFGGDGTGGPGVGTSMFSVQQNTDDPFGTGTWTDEADNPGGEIVFAATGIEGTALTPGDSVYAAVALRTAPTSIAGDVELQPAVAADGITATDPDDYLFDALDLRVATASTIFTCDATAFAGGATLIADGPLSTTGGTATQSLSADSGSVQYYCFELTLPDPVPVAGGATIEDYMGLTIAPAWEFLAES